MVEFHTETWQPRTFGRDVLETRRGMADIHEVHPNPNQPRQGPKLDLQLKKEIIENRGLFEPLFVEPHPEIDGKYRIIDGDRRHSNSLEIIRDMESSGAEEEEIDRFRIVPIELTSRTLTDEERFRIWVFIHRQRKEWTRREKEMVAYSLGKYMDRARAAAVLGITIRELDKTVLIYETSMKLTGLQDPDAAITWAREIHNVSPKYRPDDVESTLIRKINEKNLVNSKEIRQLRKIVPQEAALKEFLTDTGTISSALDKIPTAPSVPRSQTYGAGIAVDITSFSQQLGRYSWEELDHIQGDTNLLATIDEAEKKLARLKRAVTIQVSSPPTVA